MEGKGGVGKGKREGKGKMFQKYKFGGGNQLYSYASYCQKNKNDFP